MKALYIIPLFIAMLFGFSSCVEIIDDLTINVDGSGTFKYTVNLSSSKVKINSILALDSLEGRKVPSLDEIKEDIDRLVKAFDSKEGISNLIVDANYDDYMFKVSCDFSSLSNLQKAIKDVVREETKYKDSQELDHNWLSLEDDVMERSVPQITIEKAKEIKQSEKDLLKEGTYTSITRFSRSVEDYKNKNAIISKNGMAIMVKTDPFSLIEDHHLLDNTIYLKSSN